MTRHQKLHILVIITVISAIQCATVPLIPAPAVNHEETIPATPTPTVLSPTPVPTEEPTVAPLSVSTSTPVPTAVPSPTAKMMSVIVEGYSNWKLVQADSDSIRKSLARRAALSDAGRNCLEFIKGTSFTYEERSNSLTLAQFFTDGVLKRRQAQDLGCEEFDHGLIICRKELLRDMPENPSIVGPVYQVTGSSDYDEQNPAISIRQARTDAFIAAIKNAALEQFGGSVPSTIKGTIIEVRTIQANVAYGRLTLTLNVRIWLDPT